jgi:hypothetical protein
LKAWNAPSLVSLVEIDAAGGRVARQENAKVDDVNSTFAYQMFSKPAIIS